MVSSSSETEREDTDEYEATEMHGHQGPLTTSNPDPIEPKSTFIKAYCSMKRRLPRPLKDFWNHQVSATVPHDSCRDHFGYLRTSMALSIVGVLIAQLFRLQHADHPNMEIGFFVLGIPLAALCIGGSIVVLVLGAYRFWRQQNAMLRGKVHAGGWDINLMGSTVVVITLLIFILVVAVDVEKEQ